ncbi:hypothetical protein MUG10_13645 [Xanthomonas prunicola]|uniref:hypothetical protein n=1 Tax=Xanthomonas prunicola TaxID=2053930 RepID=UPI00207854C9|nr:hypothetical protein [Xanthomonas prunicola]USI99143.1 hypothetical protein MUG10_13645 [Xanthomonas prunicola]
MGTLVPHVARGAIPTRFVGVLTERVVVGSGKPQRQCIELVPQQGHWVPEPIEDPGYVDERRAAVGRCRLPIPFALPRGGFPHRDGLSWQR